MALSRSARRVQSALDAHGVALKVVELPASTRTALDAAQAVGCEVGQIVKSLVFRSVDGDDPLLVLTSGANRVSLAKLAGAMGARYEMADAEFVRRWTGFAIGGVPPVGHAHPIRTVLDRDLLRYDQIWAAAGTPRALFRLTPEQLLSITGAQALDVAE
jgi:prolyl-tRNA editing enzyme YbaK/EbsC (Cys-tRNA(Pro) deacylase)